MALQTPNRPSKLFIPSGTIGASPLNSQSTLRSAVQNNFHLPSLHVQQPSMQASFNSPFQTPGPHTPAFRARHHTNVSVAQFALNSPSPFQPSHSPFPQSPGPPSFMKSRRTASISLGGPPKALLGGPQRKPSPLSGQDMTEQKSSSDVQQQHSQPLRKKVVVNLPEESAPAIYEGKAYQSPPWARRPWPIESYLPQISDIHPLETSTRDIFTGEDSNHQYSAPFRVSLPSQETWLIWRKTVLNEKLLQLGLDQDDHMSYNNNEVGEEFDNQIPDSISSPADPALLSFKLNKLQQSRALAGPIVPCLESLASSVELNANLLDDKTASFLNVPQEYTITRESYQSNEAIASDISRPVSVRDFARGFGFNVPDEDSPTVSFGVSDSIFINTEKEPFALDRTFGTSRSEINIIAPKPLHSRHASKFSQSMEQISSLAQADHVSVKGRHSFDYGQKGPDISSPQLNKSDVGVESEHTRSSVDDADESEGEFSNPSDEERARLKRMHLRMARLSRGTEELPRHNQSYSQPPGETNMRAHHMVSQDEELVSNPSDEGMSHPEPGPHSRASRPLPPIPHSRNLSEATFNQHELSHSNISSIQHLMPYHARQQSSSGIMKDSLNPLAKPFEFGKPIEQPTLTHEIPAGTNPKPIARPSLNAFAQEFKPGNFRFKPPPGMPHMAFPSSSVFSQLQATVPASREEQGREKRLRRGSISPPCDTMLSDSPLDPHLPGVAPGIPEPLKANSLSISAKPFHPSGPSGWDVLKPPSTSSQQQNGTCAQPNRDQNLFKDENPKEAPESLDFQYHVSENRVPVSLFKSLGPLGSHSKRQSLDDHEVQSISRKVSGAAQHIAEKPDSSPLGGSTSEIGSPQEPGMPGSVATVAYRSKDVPQNNLQLYRQAEHQANEDILPNGLVFKLGELRRILETVLENNFTFVSPQQNLGDDLKLPNLRVLEQLIKDVRMGLKSDLESLFDASGLGPVSRVIEDTISRAIVPVTLVAAEISARMDELENISASRYTEDKEILLHDILAILTPRLDDLRPEPIDLEMLTARLSTAVRPEIHELIDLTSDKKETAVLIMQQLKPMLQGIAASQHDHILNSTLNFMSAELGKLLTLFDGHKLKDEISDLVFERLDSRLRLQEQKSSEDEILSTLTRTLENHTNRLQRLHDAVVSTQNIGNDIIDNVTSLGPKLSDLSVDSFRDLRTDLNKKHDTASIWRSQLDESLERVFGLLERSKEMTELSSDITDLVKGQLNVNAKLEEVRAWQQTSMLLEVPQSLDKVISLIDGVSSDLKELWNHQTSLSSSLVGKIELEGRISELLGKNEVLKKEKSELQGKYKSSDDECDILGRRLRSLEQELSVKVEEASDAKQRFKSLEETLNKTISRLDTTNISLERSWERVCELETANRELSVEKTQLQAKVEMLEMQASWVTQNVEAREKEIHSLQEDRDRLLSHSVQKSDWQRSVDQLELISKMLNAWESKEREESNTYRDRAKTLEGELGALQKRFREQESKLSNVERASVTARQNLAQTQQRAVDWEKRAADLESLLERTRQQAEQSEESRRAAETELVAMAASNTTNQAEQQVKFEAMQREISSLNAELAKTSQSLEESKHASAQAWRSHIANGLPTNSPLGGSVVPPSGSRASTPTPGLAKPFIQTPPENDDGMPMTSTWNSMHAPKPGKPHPVTRYPSTRSTAFTAHRPTSPTASVVSNAPTLQEDGWWA